MIVNGSEELTPSGGTSIDTCTLTAGQYATQDALQTEFDKVLTNGPTISDAGTNGFYAIFDNLKDQSTKYYYVVQIQDSSSNPLYCEYGQIIYGKYVSKISTGKYAHSIYHTADMNGGYGSGVQSGYKVIYSLCTQKPSLSTGSFNGKGEYIGSAAVTLNGTVIATKTITAS